MLQDFQKHLYDSYSINFLSSVSRLLLEDLATASINADVHNQIKQVYIKIPYNKDIIFF